MKQHEILSKIQSLEVKHSSLLSEYLECEAGQKEKDIYSEMLTLEKEANKLLKQLDKHT